MGHKHRVLSHRTVERGRILKILHATSETKRSKINVPASRNPPSDYAHVESSNKCRAVETRAGSVIEYVQFLERMPVNYLINSQLSGLHRNLLIEVFSQTRHRKLTQLIVNYISVGPRIKFERIRIFNLTSRIEKIITPKLIFININSKLTAEWIFMYLTGRI